MVAAQGSSDPKSGYCESNSIFYSKRKAVPLPSKEYLDVTTFISSQPHRGTTALIDAATGRSLAFGELWSSVDSVSTCLLEMGVRKGDVVLILSPNSIYFPVVCLSVLWVGAVITTTNPLNTSREMAKQIKDSNPKLAFTTPQLVPKLASANDALPLVLMDDDHQHDTAELEMSKFRILTRLKSMMSKNPSEFRVRERIHQNDAATLLYSSGTTGPSKGVVTSHRSIIAMVQIIVQRFQNGLEGEAKFICTVPMFHVYGLAAFASGLLAAGHTIIVLSKYDLHDMFSAIDKYRATCLPLVPPILVAMINEANQIRSRYDLSSLQSVLSGGAPLSKEVIEGFLHKYPNVQILQGYGLTESTAVGASTDTVDESRRYGTAGLLSPSTEAKVVDPETGLALPVNRTGELWLRGPTVMKGYFNNAEATASTLDSEGWLKTGDLCYIDEDGFIFVVDRLKELIKYKGYQVPPAELESLLLTHPEISDAAVIPFPDKEVGQYPMAYVVRKAGSNLSQNAIMDFVAKQVAPYKKIRRVAFVDAIPKNASGKILRKDLIQLATSKL